MGASHVLAAIPLPLDSSVKPAGFAEWSAKLEDAKARRRSGKRISLVGVAVAIPIMVTAGSAGALVAGSVLGFGVGGYGAYRAHQAGEEIDDLDREGRIKGYLSLAPLQGGAEVALRLTW